MSTQERSEELSDEGRSELAQAMTEELKNVPPGKAVDYTCTAQHGMMTEGFGFRFCPLCGAAVYDASKDIIDCDMVLKNAGVLMLSVKKVGRKNVKMKVQHWLYTRSLIGKFAWLMKVRQATDNK